MHISFSPQPSALLDFCYARQRMGKTWQVLLETNPSVEDIKDEMDATFAVLRILAELAAILKAEAAK